MPAYNFQKQFVPMILEGKKPHTIRRRRKHPTKAGDVLKLFTGMRTKQCRQFAEAVCVKVEPVVIWVEGKLLTKSITGQAFSKEKVKEIALSDGFDSVEEFFAFFEIYKLGVLEDFEIIHWDPKALKAYVSPEVVGDDLFGAKPNLLVIDDPLADSPVDVERYKLDWFSRKIGSAIGKNMIKAVRDETR